MSNEKHVSPERVYSIDQFANGEAGEWQTDHCDREHTTYFREDVVDELRRQNAALKAFAKKLITEQNDAGDIQDSAESLGIIVKHPATQKDVDMGIDGIDEIGDDVFTFAPWMLTDTTTIPAPSKAEVAWEFVEEVRAEMEHVRLQFMEIDIPVPDLRPEGIEGAIYRNAIRRILKKWRGE